MKENAYSSRIFTPLMGTIAIAVVAAVWSGWFSSREFLSADIVAHFSEFVGNLAPSVVVISDYSSDPLRAQFVWALQWVFFPVYLFIYIASVRPWSKESQESAAKKANELPWYRKMLAPIFLAILWLMILSDFGAIDGPSFLRGTIFSPDHNDLNSVAPKLRAVYTSTGGMVYYAVLIPLCNATLYWMCFFLSFNIKFYLK